MDLENSYDRTDQEGTWVITKIFRMGGHTLGVMKDFYEGSEGCVRADIKETICDVQVSSKRCQGNVKGTVH